MCVLSIKIVYLVNIYLLDVYLYGIGYERLGNNVYIDIVLFFLEFFLEFNRCK